MAIDARDLTIHRIEVNDISILTDEQRRFFITRKLVNLYEPVTGDQVFADTLRMAEKQFAVTAAEELYKLIIGQAGLNGYNREILSIEFLYPVGKTDPAKIIPVIPDIADGALQEAFIHTIAERIISLDGLRICWEAASR